MQHLLSTTELASRLKVCRQQVHVLFDKYGQPQPEWGSGRLVLYSEGVIREWVKRLPDKYAARFG